MDAPVELKRTDTDEPTSNVVSQDVSNREIAEEYENLGSPEDIRTLPSPSDAEPRTALHKPTFMRIERKHISAEILTKHSIPYIDDPVRLLTFCNSRLTSPGPGILTYHPMASRNAIREVLDGDFSPGRKY
jgi:hypothetical protein